MYKDNVWKKYEDSSELFSFAEDYKKAISFGKSERLFAEYSINLLEKAGFKNIDNVNKVTTGDRIYIVNKNKNVMAVVIGQKPLIEGIRVLGAHIDSPRLDIKQNPLYESTEFALLNTHYYGGIKKYQWTARPLALVGVVCKKDGTTVKVNIGDDASDPVFGIGDLLVHLSADQMKKPGSNVIEGEALDVCVGNIPLVKEKKDAVKANVLKLLKQKYGIEEQDFVSAEIEVVPAGEARDYGFDRSMIAGYGHDDRCCAFPSLRAVIDVKDPEYTSCCVLVDKEEIGSVGATGAHSLFFENAIAKLFILSGVGHPVYSTRICFENSKMLSSDVSAGVDPLYLSVNDMENSCFLSHGIVFNKYTGSRGKSGSNDANPEYIAWIRKILDEKNICYQTSELGKVDQGGGGTIAYILANYNMNVLDAGIPVLNMHAPMEVISKADLFEAYIAYKEFLLAK